MMRKIVASLFEVTREHAREELQGKALESRQKWEEGIGKIEAERERRSGERRKREQGNAVQKSEA